MSKDFTKDLHSQLIETADQMRCLADSLSSMGRSLDKEEKELAKLAMSRRVNAILDEAKFFFLMDSKDDICMAVEEVYKITKLTEEL